MLATENVSLEMESPIDTTPLLREKAVKLGKIVEAFDKISESTYWEILKEEIFNGVLESLQRKMRVETEPRELFRLQGQMVWAEKYCNLAKMAEIYRKELVNISNQLTNK